MDSDRPPERWSPLDTVGWFLSLWPALKERLHRWLHDSLPDCPYCAEWRDNADEWAEKCRAEEAAHKATIERPMVPPGTPVFGGAEEGVASWPVGDADLAIAFDTLLTGQRSRLPRAKATVPPPPAEPTGFLAYPEVVAVRFPKTPADVRELLSDCKAIAEDPKWRMSQDDYVKASLGAGVRVSCIDQWGKVIMANRAGEAEA